MAKVKTMMPAKRGEKAAKTHHVPDRKTPPKQTYSMVRERGLNADGEVNTRFYTIPWHAWLAGWYHPRRLCDEKRLNDAEKAKLRAVQKDLARLQKYLHEQLHGDRAKEIEDKGERIKAILEAAEDGLPSDEEQKVRASFGDDDVDAFLEGAFVISSPKPLYPTAPDKASFAKTLRQVKDHKDALAAWLEEVDDDEVAADELASQYSKAQLAFALAGFLKKAEKALPGLTLSAGLERERLAELVVAVVGVEKAEEVDVEKLLGDDWAAIFSGYTAHLEDHRRRNEECRLRWEEADEKEEVFDELVARGWGSGPSSSAEGFWWKVAGRSAARFFPKDDIGGEAFKKRHEEIYTIYIELWRALVAADPKGKPRCPRCGCCLKTQYRPKGRGAPRTAHPDNASPDRLDNALDYLAKGNVEIVCVACNLVRRTNSVEGGKQHVGAMKAAWREGKAKLGKGDLMVCQLEAVQTTKMEDLLIDEWARVELRDAKARCKKSETSKGKTKRCSLEHADLVAKMKACWAGDGQFFDVTGAKFDLEWASLDRIDSNGDYDVLNTRIMHVGLNCTKRECSNDLVLVPWLEA